MLLNYSSYCSRSFRQNFTFNSHHLTANDFDSMLSPNSEEFTQFTTGGFSDSKTATVERLTTSLLLVGPI